VRGGKSYQDVRESMGLRQQRAFSDPGKHLSGPALPPSMYVAVAGNSEIGLSDLVTGNSVPR
jgi:hypothetical protein